MAQLIGLHVLLYTTFLLEVHSLCVVNFTHNYASELINPTTVGDEDILTLSMSRNILSVNWTLSTNKSICQMVIDPFENAITSRLKVTRSGAKLIVWGIRKSEIIDEIRNTIYTLLLVDISTSDCKYQVVELPNDEVPISYPVIPPEVVASKQSFDVFFPTMKRCRPCRFLTVNGSQIELKEQLEMEIMRPLKSFQIQPIVSNNPNVGYFYAYNYVIGTSILKYFDKNFRIVRRKYLNHTVDVASTNLGDVRSTGICWHTLGTINCERIDSSLSTVASYNMYGDSVSIQFDTWGNTFIGVVEKSLGSRVYIYDSIGRIVEELYFGSVSASADRFEVYGYLFQKQYCMVVIEFKNSKPLTARYVLKCIKSTAYSKAPQA